MNKDKTKVNNQISLNYILIISILIIGVFFDIFTKELATQKEQSLIPNIISIFYTENTGAGFSIFSNSTLFLTIFTTIIFVGLLVFNVLFRPKSKVYAIGMGLLLAGAFGNLFDRIIFGYVRDFLRLEFMDFPIFNFADVCLTVGVILICVWLIFLNGKKKEKNGNNI